MGLPNNIYECQLGLMSESKMASSQLEHHLARRGPFPGISLPCQSFIFQDIYLRLGMIKHKNMLICVLNINVISLREKYSCLMKMFDIARS